MERAAKEPAELAHSVRRFAEHDHSPSGAARYMVKDLSAATEEARRTATPTPHPCSSPRAG